MTELQNELSLVITGEVQRAEKAHGEYYNSPHEAYAVLREEVEEAREASQHVQAAFDPNGKGGDIWQCIRLWGKIPPCRDWLARESKTWAMLRWLQPASISKWWPYVTGSCAASNPAETSGRRQHSEETA